MPQQVDGNVTEYGEVLRAMVLADTTLVFAKGSVQHPMHLVLDSPMGTHRMAELPDVSLQAADVVSGSDSRCLVPQLGRFDHTNAPQAAPVVTPPHGLDRVCDDVVPGLIAIMATRFRHGLGQPWIPSGTHHGQCGRHLLGER